MTDERAVFQIAEQQFSDVRWRLNTLYWITDKTGTRIPFRLNWAQEALLNELHYLNLILKARQIGFTTFIQLYMLDACVFNSNVRAGTIAHTREDAEAFFRDKVKYPYDNLPDQLKTAIEAVEDSARTLTFANNSSLRVGTSLRSGTLQYLHISEYGKICAKFPDKAREVKTGSLNTVQAGQIIFIESTAEGQQGDFYDKAQEAESLQRRKAELTPLDFKFFFFPWWKHPDYRMSPANVDVPARFADYFAKLEKDRGIKLDPEQKAWYVKKSIQQGEDDMWREYPSTSEEAFAASIEGAYYAREMARAESEGRVGIVPHDTAAKVDTWWDLGIGDATAIWFVQEVGLQMRVVDFYENSGYGLAHYASVLQAKQKDRGFVYGGHWWPHDGNARIMDEKGRTRTEVMRGLGYEPQIVQRGDVEDGIEAVRNLLSRCWFDLTHCEKGIKALKSYRKEWDEERSVFKKKPLHDWASNPADAFRTGAKHPPAPKFKPIEYPKNHVSRGFA